MIATPRVARAVELARESGPVLVLEVGEHPRVGDELREELELRELRFGHDAHKLINIRTAA